MEPHPPFTFLLSNRPADDRCAIIDAGLTADNSRLIGGAWLRKDLTSQDHISP